MSKVQGPIKAICICKTIPGMVSRTGSTSVSCGICTEMLQLPCSRRTRGKFSGEREVSPSLCFPRLPGVHVLGQSWMVTDAKSNKQ